MDVLQSTLHLVYAGRASRHDTLSERLRRWTRNPSGSARRGSNPLGVALPRAWCACQTTILYASFRHPARNRLAAEVSIHVCAHMSVHLRVPTRACLEGDARVHGHARSHLLRILGCATVMVPQDGVAKVKVTPVGFEPTRIAPPELESGALDHSAKVSCQAGPCLAWFAVCPHCAPPCAAAVHGLGVF